jgi:tRNA-2-methylthio-N6-dimethylallyladenosine synthase
MEKSFYIETYGCQMNEYDSELIAGLLGRSGLRQVSVPEQADIVLVNACSVRDRAEQRIWGRLGELKQMKQARPDLVFVLCGCMAQRLGSMVRKRAPYVDIVAGPDTYRRLPDIIRHQSGTPACLQELDAEETYSDLLPLRADAVQAWAAIMRGCDNDCSYCIVPSVRGPARSRPASDIVAEVRDAVERGCKEVTLLGQNVNAYRCDGLGLAGLLRRLDETKGLERIRFTTSHPRDMTAEIIQAVAEGDHICEHIHLPVQSGSTPVLEAMNRHYTAEAYLRLVDLIRRSIPDVSITTDIIVGFPGERDADFQATLNMVREVSFDSAFMFRYSPRPGTAAMEMIDDIPEEVKIERLEELIGLQRSLVDRASKEMIGRVVEVLVDGESRKGNGQMRGRTRQGQTVVFAADASCVGLCWPVMIEKAEAWTLWGRRIESSPDR